jgi:hypothetical protein
MRKREFKEKKNKGNVGVEVKQVAKEKRNVKEEREIRR